MNTVWIKNNSLKLIVIALAFSALTMAMKSKPEQSVVEANKIILKGPQGHNVLVLDASSGVAKVSFLGQNERVQMQLLGGDNPTLVLSDSSEVSRMQIQGGDQPALFIKNQNGEMVATLLTMQDGGTALGLADSEGDVSAFLRGGDTPSVSFFKKSVEPSVALGISKSVPHLLVSSPTTKDNLILHGGEPTSLLFVDSQGEIPVLLSKHGLFQGKKEQTQTEAPQENKIFTWENFINPLENKKLNLKQVN